MDPNKILYVAAMEFIGHDGSVRPRLRYMHATSSRSAELSFRHSHSRALMAGRARIIAVAPVVGYHAQDDNGDILSV
jgi:hypothetical protein